MSVTWEGDEPPLRRKIGPLGYMLALARTIPMVVLVFGCLLILFAVRLVERPLFGLDRPITPWITQFVCRNAFRLMGIRFSTTGHLMRERGAVVANHSSWLDIFALNARKRIYFVSKAEVAGWPGIGWLARATGTVFIERNRAHARAHTNMFRDRLLVGHKLLFFPEGTSTDGLRVLPFKTTLFAAFYADGLEEVCFIQPVSVCYHAPPGADPRYYGWWGDMGFGEHLIHTLSTWRQGRAELRYHTPLRVADYPNRKALAAACEASVREGHSAMYPNAITGSD